MHWQVRAQCPRCRQMFTIFTWHPETHRRVSCPSVECRHIFSAGSKPIKSEQEINEVCYLDKVAIGIPEEQLSSLKLK